MGRFVVTGTLALELRAVVEAPDGNAAAEEVICCAVREQVGRLPFRVDAIVQSAEMKAKEVPPWPPAK